MNKKAYQTPKITVFKVNAFSMIAASSGDGYDPNSDASGADQMGREGGSWFSED